MTTTVVCAPVTCKGSGTQTVVEGVDPALPPPEPSEVSKAIHAAVLAMSNLGLGLVKAFPPPTPKPTRAWKKAILKAEDETVKMVQVRVPGGGTVSRAIPQTKKLSAAEKMFVKSQPFTIIVTPPPPSKLTPLQLFRYRANQVRRNPFLRALAGPKPKKTSKAQAQLRSIVKISSHPVFLSTLKQESKTSAKFKSLALAIAKTWKILRMMDNLSREVAADEEEEESRSNEEGIRAGTNPMLKKEVLLRLFEYLPVSDLKTARLVCEYWKRFSTPALQQKSVVRLSGLCHQCKSEWMRSPDEDNHDHANTISFYRFVLYIQDIPEEKRYFKPFRNFRVQHINVYFVKGISTVPTRIFLMFLKLWGDKIHELTLHSVQMSPPDAFYRILDCCKRLRDLVFDDIRVWLNPLVADDSSSSGPLKFTMHTNYYLTSITFLTNWVGEELLHWQMILQAFPCLQELNLIDVSKKEINHCLAAILNLPEAEEEEHELRKVGAFKQISSQIIKMPFVFEKSLSLASSEGADQGEQRPHPAFKRVSRVLVNMPFNLSRLRALSELQETSPRKFKKFAQKLVNQPFPLALAAAAPEVEELPKEMRSRKLKGLSRQVVQKQQPFPASRLSSNQQQQQPHELTKKGGEKKSLKRVSTRLGRGPFGSALADRTTLAAPETSDQAGEASEASGDCRNETDPANPDGSEIGEPLEMTRKEVIAHKIKLRAKRAIINQPFTIVTPGPKSVPEIFKPKKFKDFAKTFVSATVLTKKPKTKPIDRFRKMAKNLTNQPFHLGDPIPHENVLPGSLLSKINISTRHNYEDQLKFEAGKKKGNSVSESQADSMEELSESESSAAGDDESVADSDFYEMDTNELLAEIVARFDITHLALRVNYTREDVLSLPVVLEACREKVESLTLVRPSKVYFSEFELQFLTNPFETPEETLMVFPKVRRLTLAHNIVDDINELQVSFPSLTHLSLNLVPTEFYFKAQPYKNYVRTSLMLSMKSGRAMPSVKVLAWNIEDARHPRTGVRTVVYRSHAVRHIPRIFPSLSKLSLSITTAHDLHVIFRGCSQLHELVILKNSFYRTQDEDIVGYDEVPEEVQQKTRLAQLHPTRLRNGGIKQLKSVSPLTVCFTVAIVLRRLSLENNNCCLTNESVRYGFLYLRRLRSIHISRGKRISIAALRLLRSCRFLVHVSVTKDTLKFPSEPPGQDMEDGASREDKSQENQTPPYEPPKSVVGVVRTQTEQQQGCLLVKTPGGGFQQGTKWDKIGAKRYQFVTRTYRVHGRTYQLTRRIWEETAEETQKKIYLHSHIQKWEEEALEDEEEQRHEIDPGNIIRRAEKRRARLLQDEESDYERFINDFDEDYEADEEDYGKEDDADEVLLYGGGRKNKVPADSSSSDDDGDDGLCPEADSMYEGDKEHYLDTDLRSSDEDESYCDTTVSEREYHGDKDTCDERVDPAPAPPEPEVVQAEAPVQEKGIEAQAPPTNTLQPLLLLPPLVDPPPGGESGPPSATARSTLALHGSLLEKLFKELPRRKSKQEHKRKSKEKKRKDKKKLMRDRAYSPTITVQLPSHDYFHQQQELALATEKVLNWEVSEDAPCAEYEESIRRMSLSSAGTRLSDLNRGSEDYADFYGSATSVPLTDYNNREIETPSHNTQQLSQRRRENLLIPPPPPPLPYSDPKNRGGGKHNKKHYSRGKYGKNKVGSTDIIAPLRGEESFRDLRHVLIQKMVAEVKKELRK